MKDLWKEAFGEKLGDYELPIDIPEWVPAGGRRPVRWYLPLLAGAAAAALALIFLLPEGGNRQGGYAERLIAEAHPQVSATLPSDIHPLSVARHAFTTRPSAQPVPEGAEAQDVVQDVVQDNVQDVIPGQDSPTDDQQNQQAGQQDTPDIWPAPIVDKHQARGGLSLQLHAGNLVDPSKRQEVEPTGILQLRDAKAAYYDAKDIALISNTPFKDDIPHAYNNQEISSSSWTHMFPVKAGLTLRYELTPRLGLESGLTWSLQRSRQSFYIGLLGSSTKEYRLNYIGIPLKASFKAFGWERLDIYCTAGGEADFMAFGSVVQSDNFNKSRTAFNDRHFQYSLSGAAGIDWRITDKMSLYAEPGVAWHFGIPDSVPSFYKEHPVFFDLQAGLRLRLN